jgi:hypothetical protein
MTSKDLAGLAGVLLFLAGIALIYYPAALITAGLLLFAWAFYTTPPEAHKHALNSSGICGTCGLPGQMITSLAERGFSIAAIPAKKRLH